MTQQSELDTLTDAMIKLDCDQKAVVLVNALMKSVGGSPNDFLLSLANCFSTISTMLPAVDRAHAVETLRECADNVEQTYLLSGKKKAN